MTNDNETKGKIIKVALRLFSRDGYNETSIRSLAKEASVNIASINYYFKNKLGLYKACFFTLRQEAQRIAKKLDASPVTAIEVKKTLEQFTNELIDLYVQDPNLISLVIVELKKTMVLDRSVVQARFLELYLSIEKFFIYLKENGFVSPAADTHIMASSFYGSIIHAISFDQKRKDQFNVCLRDDLEFRKKFASQLAQLYTFGMKEYGEENEKEN